MAVRLQVTLQFHQFLPPHVLKRSTQVRRHVEGPDSREVSSISEEDDPGQSQLKISAANAGTVANHDSVVIDDGEPPTAGVGSGLLTRMTATR